MFKKTKNVFSRKLPNLSKNETITILSSLLFLLIIPFSVKITQQKHDIRSSAKTHSIKNSVATPAINFPQDHGPHPNFAAEWWYLNLLSRTTKINGTNEKDMGYVISFSRIAGNNGLLSSRYDNKTKSFKENTNIGGGLNVSLRQGQYLLINYQQGQTQMMFKELILGRDLKKTYKLIGQTPEIGSFNLTLQERTVAPSGNTPLLWGGTTGNCTGKISVFGINDTFYYSIPDLDVISGTIVDVDGKTRIVKVGKAWMDHQWFNNLPPSDWIGHYWASFHFTNSTDLYDTNPHQAVGFVTQIYNDGPKFTYWVKRNADGTNECGTEGSLSVNSYGTSNYPSSWKIDLEKTGISYLQATGIPFSNNQIFTPPQGPKFYEPVSYFTGTEGNTSFTGLGFFETHLTGQNIQPLSTPTPTISPESTPTPSICKYNNLKLCDYNCRFGTCTSKGCPKRMYKCDKFLE